MVDINLDSEFMKDRVLFMHGDFNEENCSKFIKEFLSLMRKDKKKDIITYIDSYGGEIHSFIQIYNVISSFKGNVHSIVTGKTMSAGAYLLLSGTKGFRFAYKYSTIMLHEISSYSGYDKLHNHEEDLKESKRLQEILYEIVLKHTKIKKRDIEQLLQKDSYFTAKQALKLGIIDRIIK